MADYNNDGNKDIFQLLGLVRTTLFNRPEINNEDDLRNILNNSEIIEDSVSGLLYTDNLSEILVSLKDNKYDNVNLVKNAKNIINETYSKDIVFSNYLLDFKTLNKGK